jgi:hypothetical protein
MRDHANLAGHPRDRAAARRRPWQLLEDTPAPAPDPHAYDSVKANPGAALYALSYDPRGRTFDVFYYEPARWGTTGQWATTTGGLWRFPLVVKSGDRIGYTATPKKGDEDGFIACDIWYNKKLVQHVTGQRNGCNVGYTIP